MIRRPAATPNPPEPPMPAPTTNPVLADRLWPAASARVLRAVVLAVLGTLLLWASAKIQVPFYPVPMTLQTLVTVLLGMAFGARLATATVLLYLAQGALGLPVFAYGTSLCTTKLRDLGTSRFGVEIHCAGVKVRPGDLVLGDDNGVLFLSPSADLAATVIAALATDGATSSAPAMPAMTIVRFMTLLLSR